MTEFTRSDLSEFKNPGSLADFAKQNGLSDREAAAQHSLALQQYRLAKAAELGVSLEDLHEMGADAVEASGIPKTD